eukprot:803922-Ditylum_brightwellii.AAC.1
MAKVIREDPFKFGGWAQHQTRWHTSIFDDVKTPLPHFESLWFKSMQKYISKIEAQLEMTGDFIYPPQWLGGCT